jgi:hypothetical protein
MRRKENLDHMSARIEKGDNDIDENTFICVLSHTKNTLNSLAIISSFWDDDLPISP